MSVMDHVLRKIADGKRIRLLISESRAVAELVREYNALVPSGGPANRRVQRVLIDGDMSGFDLKLSIGLLTAYEQMQLLDRYLAHLTADELVTPPAPEVEGVPSDEPDVTDAKADRQLKRFMIKFLFIAVMSLVFIVIGAMVAIMARNSTMPDNALINTIMQTAGEMIKILFNANTK